MIHLTRPRWIWPLLIPGLVVLVQGSTAPPAAVPGLVGSWKVASYACVGYESVLKVNAPPVFDSGTAPEVVLVVTRQKGSVFAGYIKGFAGDDDKQLLTGVISADSSVSIQFAGHNYRCLVSGRYETAGTKKLIKATYCEFEEFLASNPSIASGYLELEKK